MEEGGLMVNWTFLIYSSTFASVEEVEEGGLMDNWFVTCRRVSLIILAE